MIKINNFLINILKGLIYLFPITFIFGNLITNIFVFFIVIFGIITFKKDSIYLEQPLLNSFSLLFFYNNISINSLSSIFL